MDKRHGILIVSVTLFVLCFVAAASATTWSVDGSGGADFAGIQDAINNASDGDTIIVYSGVYYENVVVNKSVTLIGNGQPVVDAEEKGNAISLTADGITLVGFTATTSESWGGDAGIEVTSNNNTITGNTVSNSDFGICLYESSNNSITANNIGNNGCGIYLADSSNNNTIIGNTVSNNDVGIAVRDSSNNSIRDNIISDNFFRGIDLQYSCSNNTVTGNRFVNDGLFVYVGRNVYDPYQNTVEDNTVNGKPLVYLVDVSNYKVEDAGQVILVNCNNITVENLDLSNTDVGVKLWNTEDCIITNNRISNNNGNGIALRDSSNNAITDNIISNNYRSGIAAGNSSNCTIIGNRFVNDGLNVYDLYQNTVEDNTVNGKPLVYLEDVSNYKVGDAGQVILVNCNNITVENLDLSNTDVGVKLWKTEKCIITNNNVSDNDEHQGIDLTYSSNNTITGNTVSNNDEGIHLSSSSNNTITGNNARNNKYEGIGLSYSCNNTITGNNASNNKYNGIDLSSSSNNTITGNNACNNKYAGIGLVFSSNNNAITGNNVYNNYRSIDLYDSSNNSITGNNVYNNDIGILLSYSCNNNIITGNTLVNDGLYVSSSYQNTVEDNTVNGKPLVYLEDVSDYKVEDAGQVILVNCNNITVENLVLSNTDVGVELLKTRNSRISNNTVCNNNNDIGISLYDSSNNSITGNNVYNNDIGILLSYSCNNNIITGNNASNNKYDGICLSSSSNNNTITGNNASNNKYDGIDLSYSCNNTITGNNACNNRYGISLHDSNNNNIYLNNFINNNNNVKYYYESTINIWNSPLEITYTYDGNAYTNYVGNYWDDYEGTDADGDGIGDTHYSIDSEEDECDVYPLMKPFENYILTTSAPA